MNQDVVSQLVSFLADPKPEVRKIASENILPLSCSPEGRQMLCTAHAETIPLLVRYMDDTPEVAHNTLRTLVNLSQEDPYREKIITSSGRTDGAGIMVRITDSILDSENVFRELYAMLLSNLTQHPMGRAQLLQARDATVSGLLVLRLIDAFLQSQAARTVNPPRRTPGEAPPTDPLKWVATVLMNIAHEPDGARLLIDPPEDPLFAPLLPALRDPDLIRRGGAVGTLKNILMHPSTHPTLIRLAGQRDDASLPLALVTPLTGPGEYREEETAAMHPSLLALTQIENRPRESDAKIRELLLEALTLFASTRQGREQMRAVGVYPLIREYDLTETEENLHDNTQKLVDFLARDEAQGTAVLDAPEHATG
eukprot:gnl/Trimastix_PCT/1832.p1 GENE.gnl/Trimastix_PCT/1832~~gnl/Trimastix_PCT/1832.p1  ORF type:complete len:377 (+),score=125.48 gnl/Trimastix_PCT/1832:29-1132(+)